MKESREYKNDHIKRNTIFPLTNGNVLHALTRQENNIWKWTTKLVHATRNNDGYGLWWMRLKIDEKENEDHNAILI